MFIRTVHVQVDITNVYDLQPILELMPDVKRLAVGLVAPARPPGRAENQANGPNFRCHKDLWSVYPPLRTGFRHKNMLSFAGSS